MMKFENLFKELVSTLSSNTIERFDHTLVIDIDGLGVVISEMKADESVMIFTTLCSLPESVADRLDVYQKLLKANAFFAATSGYTLAVGNSNEVILQGLINYSVLNESGTCACMLETFCNVATYWRQKIEQVSSGASAEDKQYLSQMFGNSILV